MRLIWNRHTRSLMLRLVQLLPIRRRSVMCVCWGGEQWNCNPRAIVERLVGSGEWGVAVTFRNLDQFRGELPVGVEAVEIGSLRYFRLLATSQFIIANTRFGGGMWWPFPKRRGQIYIQTMHGGHGMKKQELEVSETLGEAYIRALYDDASRIDLMISDSRFWTQKARTIFAYPEGEIMEVGLPRNDIFFASAETKRDIKLRLCQKLNIADAAQSRFLIYCPTFRNNGRKDVYGFETDSVVKALEQRFGGTWYVLVSSHPNMRSYYRDIYDFSHPRMKDIGAEDLTPILAIGDAAITDYSSAGFEFALNQKPCFLLCRDLSDYDRGVYFDLRTDLPFPYATTDAELIQNILSFDSDKYLCELERFNRDVIGLCETGHAAEAVVRWMEERAK